MNIFYKVLILSFLTLGSKAFAQTVTCPAPVPSSPNCYQTSRAGNALVKKPPLPNQDCCNAIALCEPVNEIANGAVIPDPAGTGLTIPIGTIFPGCVRDELPNSTCFSNNERGTSWYKFQIRPLPNGPTNFGDPAGKLRFRIIPKDAFDDPNYDPDGADNGSSSIGETDYDFLLFDVTEATNSGDQCSLIKNSTTFSNPTSIIKSCNWSGTKGPTGLFEPGVGSANALGPAFRFNKPLDVTVGQVFILAIDNYSIGNQGFTVDFRSNSTITVAMGATATVTPPPVDSIKFTRVKPNVCPSKSITLRFNAELICDSVIPSKFKIKGQNQPYSIQSIVPEGGCNGTGTDTSFVMTISPDVADSNLQVSITSKIRDLCGNSTISDSIKFKIVFCTVSVKENTSISDKVFIVPNPNSGKFQIISHKEIFQNSTVTILDMQGKEIVKSQPFQNKAILNLDFVPKGLYIVKVQNENSLEIIRLVKE